MQCLIVILLFAMIAAQDQHRPKDSGMSREELHNEMMSERQRPVLTRVCEEEGGGARCQAYKKRTATPIKPITCSMQDTAGQLTLDCQFIVHAGQSKMACSVQYAEAGWPYGLIDRRRVDPPPSEHVPREDPSPSEQVSPRDLVPDISTAPTVFGPTTLQCSPSLRQFTNGFEQP